MSLQYQNFIEVLNQKEKEELSNILGNIEETHAKTIEQIAFELSDLNDNDLLFLKKVLSVTDKRNLAKVVKEIISVERYNEVAKATTGKTIPTYFGWFD